MKTIPVPVRLDKAVQKMLRDGARRTPHNKQDLIRLTLRRHLGDEIEQESVVKSVTRVTNVEPWPKRVIEAAYRGMGKDWDAVEDMGTRAQGRPDYSD